MPHTHKDLWQRLLSGQLTEVFLIGAVLSSDLPQTLGLEPVLMSSGYTCNPDGTPRTHAQFARVVQELAASKRWISSGLWPTWAEVFMEHAQVILVFALPGRPARHHGQTADLAKWIGLRFGRRSKRAGDAGEGLGFALDDLSRRMRPRNPVADLADMAAACYPEKVLYVTNRSQVRLLRKVRALPAEVTQAPGSSRDEEPGA